MLTWSLFYTSLFDVRKMPVVDIVDPGGVVRSQVIKAPDQTLRLTLNGADNARTVAGRFIADRMGSAVQHVALATDDIFASAAAMAARGFAVLTMPANYYDDLAPRFSLPDDTLARLRAANILYDEDDTGSFFQFYSQPYGDGFFFEIVQRTGGYAGYGAANAPFRTAAQRRHLTRDTTV